MLAFALTRIPGVLPPSFSAVYALAFCAGAFLPGRMAWWLPLTLLLSTDLVLNFFIYDVNLFNLYMLANYAGFALLIGLGRWFTSRSSWLALLGGGILGAVLFYLLTNSCAWLQNPGYPKTIAGWFQALTTGIPGFPPTWTFFRNTLLSGGLFTGLFAGVMKWSEALEPEEDAQPAEEPEEAEPEESQA